MVVKSIIFFVVACLLLSARGEDPGDLIDRISTKIANIVVGEDENLAGKHSSVVNLLLDRTLKEAGKEIKKLQDSLITSDDATKTRLQIELLKEIMKKVKILNAQKGGDGQIAPRFLSFIANKIKALAGAVVGAGVGSMMGAIKGAEIATSGCSTGNCLLAPASEEDLTFLD